MLKPKNGLVAIFLLLFLMSQNLLAQSGPITIHGPFDKPDTKIAINELFYDLIDDNDIDSDEAELDDQFLIVKNYNAKRNHGKLIIDGNKIFTTDLDELPFLPSVDLLNDGHIWLREVGYFHDNFENITTVSESISKANQEENTILSEGCINFVIDESFTNDYIGTIEDVQMYLNSIFCCPSSSPVTFYIVPMNSDVASGSPLYSGKHVDTLGGCNGISENPFLTGLLGEPQSQIGFISINNGQSISGVNNINWNFDDGILDDEVDFFSVLIHEFLHASGFGSRITLDGSPLGGVYSPWDMFLKIGDDPILERVPAPDGADCCYTFKIDSDLIMPDDLISASQNGELTIAGISVCNTDSVISSNDELGDMLSHIDEDCSKANCGDPSTFSQYVINSDLCLGEIRQEFSEDEIDLLQTLGFCTNTSGDPSLSCYVSLIDDSAIVTVGDQNGVFIDIFANDVLPTEFEQADDFLDLTCGDVSGISFEFMDGGVQVEGSFPGTYCFCYTIETCDEFCDQAEVCVSVRAGLVDTDCEPEECLLNCYGDFEIFAADPNNFIND